MAWTLPITEPSHEALILDFALIQYAGVRNVSIKSNMVSTSVFLPSCFCTTVSLLENVERSWSKTGGMSPVADVTYILMQTGKSI